MNEHNATEYLFRYADILRGVPDDEAIKALAERNEQRRQQAIAELGSQWLGHPINTRTQ